MRVKNGWAVVLVLLIAVLGTVAFAQEITGTLVGTVKDASGAVIRNATVTVKNMDTNVVVRTVTTTDNGEYVATLLPIGRYSVTVEASGFKTITQSKIDLNVNEKLTFNFAMQIGGSHEQITVEANPLQVELQQAATAGLINGTQIRELSLNNRNYTQLVSLMPGVSSTQAEQFYVGLTNPLSGGTNTVGMSINGQRTSANNWTVDGADNVDRGSNLTLLTTPSVDTIAEFKVLRSNYNAEFGRSGASQINVISRSGTSSFHGSAYEFWRNDKLNADYYFTKQTRYSANKPLGCENKSPEDCDTRKPLRYHNFGYTLGGPVFIPGVFNTQRDKTFFFFSNEFRRVIDYSSHLVTMPTADELRGVFARPVCVQFNANGTCAATGTQVSSIHPLAKAYIDNIYSKVPLGSGILTGRNVRNFFRNVSNFRQESLKIDHVFSPKLTIYGRYLHDSVPTEEPLGLFGPNTYLPGVGNTKTNVPGSSFVTRATATLSPTLMFEVGYNLSQGAIYTDVMGLMNPENSPAIQPDLPFTPTVRRQPSLAWSAAGGLPGLGSYGPYEEHNRNHQWLGNISKIYGKHTLKFGGSYYYYQKTENAAGLNAGTFTVDSVGHQAGSTPAGAERNEYLIAQAWANFLMGRLNRFQQDSVDITPDVRAHQMEFYGQDEWRILPNLTLSYGVRYSNYRQPIDKAGYLTNFDPKYYDPAKAPQLTAAGDLVPGTGDLLNGIVPSKAALEKCKQLKASGQVPVCWAEGTVAPYGDKVGPDYNTAFAPRVGIAWDPFGDGKTSVRTGYGLFYDTSLFGVVEQNIFGNMPFVNRLDITVGATFDNVNTGSLALWSTPKVVGSRIDPNYKTPYVQNWNLSIQHQITPTTLLDIAYVGNKGTHLIGQVDINQPLPGAYIQAGISDANTGINSNALTKRLNHIRPYKGYDAIPSIRSWFNSNYNSLQVSLDKRFKGKSQVGAAYTWSHALTDNQTDRSTPPRSIHNMALDYGPMQQDRRHVFSANFVYELPFFQNKGGFLGAVLGGWDVSGILSAATGSPLTILDGTSTRADRAGQGCYGASPCNMFPDVVGDIYAIDPNASGWYWFNPKAFASVPAGQVRHGNARRGQVYGPGYWRQDLSLFKNIRFTEQVTAQFRAEAFNVFNHTNPSGLYTAMTSSYFGQVSSTRDPRILQLGLKVNF